MTRLTQMALMEDLRNLLIEGTVKSQEDICLELQKKAIK